MVRKNRINNKFFSANKKKLNNEYARLIGMKETYSDFSYWEKRMIRIIDWYNHNCIAIKIVLLYFVLGATWIIFSDSILATLPITSEQAVCLAILKGWIYVVITSIVLYMLISKNIRENDYSKARLKESDASFKLAINIAKDGIWYWNAQSGQGIFSSRWSKMVGLPEKEISLSYDEWIEYVHADDRDIVRKAHEDYIERRIPVYETEYRIRTKGGSYKWVLSRAQAVWDEYGNTIFMAGSNTDITDQKNLQKELERKIEENKALLNEVIEYDKLRAEFFSNISHELRTPLNVIYSTLQLIDLYYKEDKVVLNYDKMNKYIKIMRQNCYRQLRLINNLIDITRIDSGYLQMNLKNYDIVQVVEKIANSVYDYIKNMDITFKFNTNVVEKIIACDADKIERIMLNLLSNAIKFTPAGGNVWVNVIDKEDKVFICVKDNGIGIPKDKQEIIFERFRQVNNLYTRDYEGSGIGLSLVKSLVEKHEGRITVNSELGVGSEFCIELPVKVILKDNNYKAIYNDSNNVIDFINVEFSDIYLNEII